MLSDLRRGKNTRHLLTGLLRQSVFGRLAGYEDVNDAERLSRDPTMRTIVDRKGLDRRAASSSQMGRLETDWPATEENLAVLSDFSGLWIDRVHDRKEPKIIILDMDSSGSPTHGDQEGAAYNGHFGRTCHHPLFCFNQLGNASTSWEMSDKTPVARAPLMRAGPASRDTPRPLAGFLSQSVSTDSSDHNVVGR